MLSKPTAAIGREGGGMHRLQNEVALSVNHVALGASIAAPQHVNDVLTMSGQRLDGCIGEILPPQCGVAVGLMSPHGEGRVEQQHSLSRPAAQVTALGDGCAEVVVYLFKDVL